MASIHREQNGRKTIQFVAPDGRRRSLRLGKVSLREAEMVKRRIEDLLAARITGGTPSDETSRWLAQRDKVMTQRLAAVDLIPMRMSVSLGDWTEEYITKRTDIKPRTTINLRQAQRYLLEFFGAERRLDSITPGDGDEYRLWLMRRVAENTARRHCGRAKQFFHAAVRKRLLEASPFADLKGCGVRPNRSREYFITPEEAQRVLDACPNAQWRLLFALCRWGGLRCPSETLTLTWDDIDWERSRMNIRCLKTEHHADRQMRQVPIFPEIRLYLDDVFDAAAPRSSRVITLGGARGNNANIRMQFQRIVMRAGIQPWPKLFQNLRASRETELVQTFPLHVVTKWLGNSPTVTMGHYLQVRETDYDAALQPSAASALQKAVQHLRAGGRTEATDEEGEEAERAPVADETPWCAFAQLDQVPPDGLEPSTL